MQVTSEVTSAKCHPMTRPYLHVRAILTKLQNSFGGKNLLNLPHKGKQSYNQAKHLVTFK